MMRQFPVFLALAAGAVVALAAVSAVAPAASPDDAAIVGREKA